MLLTQLFTRDIALTAARFARPSHNLNASVCLSVRSLYCVKTTQAKTTIFFCGLSQGLGLFLVKFSLLGEKISLVRGRQKEHPCT